MSSIYDLVDRFDRAHENLSKLLRGVHLGHYDVNSDEYKILKNNSDLEYAILEKEFEELKAAVRTEKNL